MTRVNLVTDASATPKPFDTTGVLDGYTMVYSAAGGKFVPSAAVGSSNPTGAAGGDLSGTYPNPGVAKLAGVAAASYAKVDSQAFTGTPSTPVLTIGGITGTIALRLVGAVASGPPVTGAFLAADMVLSLADGRWYVCTVGGSPGTWITPQTVSPITPPVVT